MADREKVIGLLQEMAEYFRDCRSNASFASKAENHFWELQNAANDALELLKDQEKEIKALRLLVEWAEECDFGFDQFPDEYERHKDEIKDMKHIDGMIHIAKRTLEDHGAFEGRSVKRE